jgi:hypothetical protein
MIVFCALTLCLAKMRPCEEQKKNKMMKAVEKCIDKKKENNPLCPGLDAMVNECTKRLSRCYDKVYVENVKKGYMGACLADMRPCDEKKKYLLRKAVEKCIDNKKEITPICSRLDAMVNVCTKPLSWCYDEEFVNKVKNGYLETFLFSLWNMRMEAQRDYDTTMIKSLNISTHFKMMKSLNISMKLPSGSPPRPYLLRYVAACTSTKSIRSHCNARVDGGICKSTEEWTSYYPFDSCVSDSLRTGEPRFPVFGNCSIVAEYLASNTSGKFGLASFGLGNFDVKLSTCFGDENFRYVNCAHEQSKVVTRSEDSTLSKRYPQLFPDHNKVLLSSACEAFHKLVNVCLAHLKPCTYVLESPQEY